MPVKPNVLEQMAATDKWEMIEKPGRSLSREKSAKSFSGLLQDKTPWSPMYEKQLNAMKMDKDAGGPFLRFLNRYMHIKMLI